MLNKKVIDLIYGFFIEIDLNMAMENRYALCEQGMKSRSAYRTLNAEEGRVAKALHDDLAQRRACRNTDKTL